MQGGKPKMFLSETFTGKQLLNDILMTENQQLVLENNGFRNRKKALRKSIFRLDDIFFLPCRKHRMRVVIIAKIFPCTVPKIETWLKETWPVDLTENELDIHSSKIKTILGNSVNC